MIFFQKKNIQKQKSVINPDPGGARGVNRGARGVMVIVVGFGYSYTSSNPGRD